uniref:CSON008924 protein n=1 Tax=Culicoides sonorensis TaxID=179676 RepID=A0A336LG45_CULSO
MPTIYDQSFLRSKKPRTSEIRSRYSRTINATLQQQNINQTDHPKYKADETSVLCLYQNIITL